jgi:hypothetical protein
VSRAAWLLVVSAGLAAQTDTRIRGPFLGYVFERGAGLRPILGMPGASSIGEPVAIGVDTAANPQWWYIWGPSRHDRSVTRCRVSSELC